MSPRTYAAAVNAPDFPPALDWLNTDRPLSIKDLRGKVVLLDFWTSGCVNCRHVMPRLRRLARKYANELAVIGVHSAKFPGEKDTAAVEQAVRRLSVDHPVVNDRDRRVWREYAVSSWPTVMLIDPRGKVVGVHEGEFTLDEMDAAIARLIGESERRLDRRPLSFGAARNNGPDGPLCFPGKVLADGAGKRLFVADTGHHRTLELSMDGRLRRAFGNGKPGFEDGDPESARFRGPQGLALDRDWLYVADTDNHVVRRIDLANALVVTVAGTGEPAHGPHRGGPAGEVPLLSPWDVVAHRGRVYVAMAGLHQLWEVEPLDRAVPWVGNGRENMVDGPADEAQFAQPSGLALGAEAEALFVADSEASGVRAVALEGGYVHTVVGTGLFDFGDADGVGDAVRLQRPLGLTFAGGVLYIADAYNHKIKRCDPATRRVTGWLGTGEPGHRDGPATKAQFSEPGGLSFADGKLYVADTNNHAIRVCDARTGRVRTLEVRM
jgi:thiol-disulfide isomerase/thioredoxin/sugar lactone lactonase YvrE